MFCLKISSILFFHGLDWHLFHCFFIEGSFLHHFSRSEFSQFSWTPSKKKKDPWLFSLHGYVSTVWRRLFLLFALVCIEFVPLLMTNEDFHVIFIFPLHSHVTVDLSHRRMWIFPHICSHRCVPDARLCYRWMEKRPVVFSRVSECVSFPVGWVTSLSLRCWHRDDVCFLFCQTLWVSFTPSV